MINQQHPLFLRDDLLSLPCMDSLAEQSANRHLLLTGATGFFGRWLLALFDELNRRGAGIAVTVVSRNPGRFLDNQPYYRDCAWLRWVPTDIRHLRELPGRPIDLILHGAADTSAVADARPLELFDTIVEGARRVLDLALHSGGARVLLTGSGAQYGTFTAEERVSEEYAGACKSNRVSSTYGEAKRAQEILGAIYAQEHALEVVMTRCFAFSGPGLPLDAHFAIGNFVRDALNADEIVLNSSGQALRSYLHGADLAVWLLTLLLRGESCVPYNVGSDEVVSIAELARRVIDRVAPGKRVRTLGLTDDSGRSLYVPDISRARKLGLDVWTTLDESIDRMAAWAKAPGYVN